VGDLAALLRPELLDLTAYVPADPPGIDVRLDANESPPPRSPQIREAVVRAVEQVALERYPDARATRLRAQISARTGAKPGELLIGTGSDEVISLLATALARPREGSPQPVVLTPTPTFVMYRVTARAHGWKPVEVPLDKAWDLDVGQMERAIAMLRPSIIYVASPNNPTGNAMSAERIERIVAAASEALVIVDEAYGDFAGESLRAWRAKHANLGILRTLSKVGLAALRVGWLEADAALVREIDKARQPFNVSATSQAAAAGVLENAWGAVQEHVADIVRERGRVAGEIATTPGFEVTPSAANFVWVKTPRPAAEALELLRERGILVRSFHAWGGRLAHQLRVTIGTPNENDRLLEGLRKCA
jgi:histidinol-phosphate aminotransferase